MTPDQPSTVPIEVVLHEERLRVDTRHAPYERAVLRRRIVEEVRTVEVTVRREELVVEQAATGVSEVDDGAPFPRPPLVVVLSEEVPVVAVQTRPYERVTVDVVAVSRKAEVTETVGREQVDMSEGDVPGPS